MQETEKQDTVTSSFSEGWVSYVTDLNHSIVQMPMPLAKGEEVQLLLNVTAPSYATPGRGPILTEERFVLHVVNLCSVLM